MTTPEQTDNSCPENIAEYYDCPLFCGSQSWAGHSTDTNGCKQTHCSCGNGQQCLTTCPNNGRRSRRLDDDTNGSSSAATSCSCSAVNTTAACADMGASTPEGCTSTCGGNGTLALAEDNDGERHCVCSFDDGSNVSICITESNVTTPVKEDAAAPPVAIAVAYAAGVAVVGASTATIMTTSSAPVAGGAGGVSGSCVALITSVQASSFLSFLGSVQRRAPSLASFASALNFANGYDLPAIAVGSSGAATPANGNSSIRRLQQKFGSSLVGSLLTVDGQQFTNCNRTGAVKASGERYLNSMLYFLLFVVAALVVNLLMFAAVSIERRLRRPMAEATAKVHPLPTTVDDSDIKHSTDLAQKMSPAPSGRNQSKDISSDGVLQALSKCVDARKVMEGSQLAKQRGPLPHNEQNVGCLEKKAGRFMYLPRIVMVVVLLLHKSVCTSTMSTFASSNDPAALALAVLLFVAVVLGVCIFVGWILWEQFLHQHAYYSHAHRKWVSAPPHSDGKSHCRSDDKGCFRGKRSRSNFYERYGNLFNENRQHDVSKETSKMSGCRKSRLFLTEGFILVILVTNIVSGSAISILGDNEILQLTICCLSTASILVAVSVVRPKLFMPANIIIAVNLGTKILSLILLMVYSSSESVASCTLVPEDVQMTLVILQVIRMSACVLIIAMQIIDLILKRAKAKRARAKAYTLDVKISMMSSNWKKSFRLRKAQTQRKLAAKLEKDETTVLNGVGSRKFWKLARRVFAEIAGHGAGDDGADVTLDNLLHFFGEDAVATDEDTSHARYWLHQMDGYGDNSNTISWSEYRDYFRWVVEEGGGEGKARELLECIAYASERHRRDYDVLHTWGF